MKTRRTGYCPICDSNVVHARFFDNRLAWQLDRLTFGILAMWNVGPWRCVDCGNRQMLIERREVARREVSDRPTDHDPPAAIGNFIRTRESLAHAISNGSRFSEKYRAGVVQKLLTSETTVSRVCRDLGVSELEVQQWIRGWVETELLRARESANDSTAVMLLTTPGVPDSDAAAPANQSANFTGPGRVIEIRPTRKPG